MERFKRQRTWCGYITESTGLYSARFVDRFGKRKHKRFKKLQECRAWLADAIYVDEHSDISMPSDMLVDHWFDYWIGIKKKTAVRIRFVIIRRDI